MQYTDHLSDITNQIMHPAPHPMAHAMLTIMESLYGYYRLPKRERFCGLAMKGTNSASGSKRWLISRLSAIPQATDTLIKDHYVTVAEDPVEMRMIITYAYGEGKAVLAESATFEYYEFKEAMETIAFFLMRGSRREAASETLIGMMR